MSADVDIDFADRNNVLELIKHIPARQENNGEVRKHNSGVYVTPVPVDPIQGCASLDYREAEQRGYFKIDFLNQSVYTLVRDQAHYDAMLAKEPDWNLLLDQAFCEQVVHISNYHDLVCAMRPDSIPRMAAFIAIIRPGKAHLQRQPWETVFASVWDGNDSRGFVFKKSHSLGYAKLIALHINLLEQAQCNM
jgi:hypothetical protein